MIDHMNLPVSDLRRSKAFYGAVLACLGYKSVAEDGAAIGYGHDCWRFGIEVVSGDISTLHVAFTAASISEVDNFFLVALDCGGVPNGQPGYRFRYGPDYYAAFVFDPDQHNIEAVYRGARAGG